MKLKIICDGTQYGTSVVNAETGERVEGAQSIELIHEAGSAPRATIVFHGVPYEFVSGSLKRYELRTE